MVVVEDVDSQQSCTGPEVICISSSEEEEDNQQLIEEEINEMAEVIYISSSEEEDDNQQPIEEEVNETAEVIHMVPWHKRVTNAMAMARSRQSLHFPSHVSRRFLKNKHQIMMKCPETGFSYKCDIEIARQTKDNKSYHKRIGKGWYKFMDEHKPQPGDTLWFELSYPPYVLTVQIERKSKEK